MVAPTKGPRVYHVQLKDKDGNNEVPLRLLQDEEGRLQYGWQFAPALAPDVQPADVSYAQFTSDLELNWGQEDWSGGALQFYHNRNRPNMYGLADKVWALTPNELALGLNPKEVSFGVKNGGAQMNATTGWAVSGVTLTAETTAPHAGPYHFQAADMAANDYAEATIIDATDQPAARWQSKSVTAIAMVRGTGSSGSVRLQLVETGGASTPTTSGTSVVLTTSYQQVSVSVTIQSDTTGLTLRVEMSTGSSQTVYFDTVNIYAGSAVSNASHCRMQMQGTSLIVATDRAIWKFNEDEDFLMLQEVMGAAITGLALYDDRLLIGQGEGTAYRFGDVGDPSTSAASTLASTQQNANRFGVTINVNGNWAAVKTLNDDEVFLATDPTNAGDWGQAIEVGKDDQDINQVFDLGGVVAVGKEDGLYRYLSLDGNRFENTFPQAVASPALDNFTRGLMYGEDFYSVQGETGLWRMGAGGWQSLAHVIQSPGFPELGNRVRAFGTDGDRLLVLVEDLTAGSITKECWLMSLKEFQSGWNVHTLCKFVMTDALDIMTFKVSGATNRFLYINGDLNGQPFMQRIQLPDRTDTPRLATNKDLPLSGTFITSYMDWNRAQVEKAINRYQILSQLMGSTQTITVGYEKDDETSFTNINSSGSIFSASPRQIIAVNEGVTGRRIRFQLTFTTDDSEKTAVVKSTVLDVTWRPPRLRRWDLIAALEEDVLGLLGVDSGIPASRQLVRLNLLEKDASPLQILDIDGSKFRGHIIDMQETQYKVHPANPALRYTRAVRLSLAEATVIVAGEWDSGIRWDEFFWG